MEFSKYHLSTAHNQGMEEGKNLNAISGEFQFHDLENR